MVSQSPAGSAADFHAASQAQKAATMACRNPPQGPPPISTLAAGFGLPYRSESRNPPQGPPPISTPPHVADLALTTNVSQSPAGSAADFHPDRGCGVRDVSRVAIPRRVRRRFPHQGVEPFSVELQSRNPPQGPPPISTPPGPHQGGDCSGLSQSPAGSAADFHWTEGGLLHQRRSVSQSPAGSAADFHRGTSKPLILWAQKGPSAKPRRAPSENVHGRLEPPRGESS